MEYIRKMEVTIMQTIVSELFSWLKAIFITTIITIFITVFLIQPYTVNGNSMEPTFQGKIQHVKDSVGDKVWINKSAYSFGEPSYGDIIIIESNFAKSRSIKDQFIESPIVQLLFQHDKKADSTFWIKRVVGKEGDTLEYKSGVLYRNGEAVNENYINEEMLYPFETTVVPEDHVFVMGDNRNHSTDSRTIGPVPNKNIVGKVIVRYYPFSKVKVY